MQAEYPVLPLNLEKRVVSISTAGLQPSHQRCPFASANACHYVDGLLFRRLTEGLLR